MPRTPASRPGLRHLRLAVIGTVAVAAIGCGRVRYDASGGPEDAAAADRGAMDAGSRDAGASDAAPPMDAGFDAGSMDASALDAGSDAGPMDAGFDAGYATGPFGTPRQVTELFDGTHQQQDPTISYDGLEMIYADTNAPSGGYNDLWDTTRATTSDPWGTPHVITELNSSYKDQTPSFSADALTLWFSSDRIGASNDDIYVTTRATRTSTWSAPTLVTELMTSMEDRGTCVWNGDLDIAFNRGSTTSGPFDLYTASRPTRMSPWSTPVPITELNTAVNDQNPYVSPDGTVMFFVSNRTGSMGPQDIWTTTRASNSGPWGTPTNVTELNSTSHDDDPTVTADGHILVFDSDRTGLYTIYETHR